ncbi:2-dehydropantoate 2-reductase N-terminal domain-containing protein, partial [Vibrio parahaemolyticus]
MGLGGVGGLLAALLRDAGMKVTALDQKQPRRVSDGIAFTSGDVGDT